MPYFYRYNKAGLEGITRNYSIYKIGAISTRNRIKLRAQNTICRGSLRTRFGYVFISLNEEREQLANGILIRNIWLIPLVEPENQRERERERERER